MDLKTRRITAFKCISNHARSQPPSVSPNTHHYGLQVPLLTRSISAAESISMFTRSQTPCVTPNLLDHNIQGMSKSAQSRRRSASLYSLDHGFHDYHHPCSITTSKWISILNGLRPWRVTLSSLDHSVVKLWSEKADCSSSTLCHTSHGIGRDFCRTSSSGSKNVGRG